jgi:tetratricopeptide (TPR) repeat protein
LRLALAYALNGQFSAASAALDQALKLGSEDAAYHEYSTLVAGLAGWPDKALTSVGKLQQLAHQHPGVLPWSLARAWTAAGDLDKAVEYLEQAFMTRSSSMPFLGQSPLLSSIRNLEKVRVLMKGIGLP